MHYVVLFDFMYALSNLFMVIINFNSISSYWSTFICHEAYWSLMHVPFLTGNRSHFLPWKNSIDFHRRVFLFFATKTIFFLLVIWRFLTLFFPFCLATLCMFHGIRGTDCTFVTTRPMAALWDRWICSLISLPSERGRPNTYNVQPLAQQCPGTAGALQPIFYM